MRRFITIIVGLVASGAMAQLPQPPGGPPSLPPSQAPKLDLSIPEIKITPQALPAMPPPNLIQPMSSNTRSVKPGDKVRVKLTTTVYSSDNEKAYRCGQLLAGQEVVVFDLPDPGSKFAAIACPEDCYALIPTEYVYPRVFLTHKQPANYMKQPHPVTGKIVPLIDGTPPNGIHQPAKNSLQKGELVTVRGEKQIQIDGKTKVYCLITTAGKDVRYAHAADLEGVVESASAVAPPPAFHQMNQQSSPLHSRPTTPWPPVEPVNQSTYVSEQLPTQWLNLVQAAEEAYRRGMQTGVWEDARMRYQQLLLDSEIVSIRILAKNRLEFIRDWQQSPPVQTAARTNSEPSYAISHSGPWIPGDVAARLPRQPAMTTSLPAYVPTREVVVRPPPATTSNPNTFANPSRPTSPLDIPVPPGVGAGGAPQQQMQQQPPPGFAPSTAHPTVVQPQPQKQPTQPALPVSAAGTNPNRLPAQPTTAPQAQRVTNIVGTVRRAVYYSGSNPIFYLTNSSGNTTYYVRGSQLLQFQDKPVRLEGMLTKVPIEGKPQQLIQVDKVELLK